MSSQEDGFLEVALDSAKKAGNFLLENFKSTKKVNEDYSYDIKLQLDRDCQDLLENNILKAFPDHNILGEEGIRGTHESIYQWILDPIDGTVNYFFGIPHFCISIALRKNNEDVVGVIFDPNMNEMWAVKKGMKATLNGNEVCPSARVNLSDSIITVGCSKTSEGLEVGLKRFREVSLKAKKVRMMGSAALGMAYISCGRLDAYIEDTINIWDIAAGKMLIEAGGGLVKIKENREDNNLSLIASNGKVNLNDIPSLAI